MKEERMGVLNLLKEGKISAEEAERLLRALEQGAEERGRSREHQRPPRPDRPGDESMPFREFGRMFRGFGKAFGSTMRSSFGEGAPGRRYDESEGYEEVEYDRSGYHLDPGASLVIRQPRHVPHAGGEIRVTSAGEGPLAIDAEDEHSLKRNGSEYVLIVVGDCVVRLPEHCSELTVSIFSGDVSIDGVLTPVTVNTMNGDIELDGVVLRDSCTTMSGDIGARLSGIEGSGPEVTTMSGDIDLSIPHDFSGSIQAETMSGEIELDLPDARIRKESGSVGRKLRASLSDSPDAPLLRCTTMSGDISVTSSSPGEPSHANAG